MASRPPGRSTRAASDHVVDGEPDDPADVLPKVLNRAGFGFAQGTVDSPGTVHRRWIDAEAARTVPRPGWRWRRVAVSPWTPVP
jgi:hypothetical protein